MTLTGEPQRFYERPFGKCRARGFLGDTIRKRLTGLLTESPAGIILGVCFQQFSPRLP